LPDSGLKSYPPRLYNGIVHATNMKARQKERKNIVKLVERNASFRAYVSYT
jgi:hypothetical protein